MWPLRNTSETLKRNRPIEHEKFCLINFSPQRRSVLVFLISRSATGSYDITTRDAGYFTSLLTFYSCLIYTLIEKINNFLSECI